VVWLTNIDCAARWPMTRPNDAINQSAGKQIDEFAVPARS
jgi:hypothetical protein